MTGKRTNPIHVPRELMFDGDNSCWDEQRGRRPKLQLRQPGKVASFERRQDWCRRRCSCSMSRRGAVAGGSGTTPVSPTAATSSSAAGRSFDDLANRAVTVEFQLDRKGHPVGIHPAATNGRVSAPRRVFRRFGCEEPPGDRTRPVVIETETECLHRTVRPQREDGRIGVF